MISDDDLDAIQARVDALDDHPWTWTPDNGAGHTDDTGLGAIKAVIYFRPHSGRYGFTDAEADFIANAQRDVPTLVAEVRRLRGLMG